MPDETYNPWTVVNIVFHHLVDQGLHPTFGDGHPGDPAAELLRALGIRPEAEGDARQKNAVHDHLEQLRRTVFDEP